MSVTMARVTSAPGMSKIPGPLRTRTTHPELTTQKDPVNSARARQYGAGGTAGPVGMQTAVTTGACSVT